MILFIISLVVLGIGVLLFLVMLSTRNNLGSIAHETISIDSIEKPGTTLYSSRLHLVGRPDYLVKIDEKIIPVEVKNGKTPSAPYKNHIVQLIAYCLLIEDQLGSTPEFGIVRYPHKEYKITYSKDLKKEVLMLIDEIKKNKDSNKEFTCSHPYHNF